MAPKYKITTIQLYSKPLSPALNFRRASHLIRSAALSGTQLAVLPEFHLLSWCPSAPTFASLAASTHDAYLSAYQALARELSICIVPGTMLKPTAAGPLLNVCYFISSTGEVVGSYAKKNLWHTERGHLVADRETPHAVFDTPLGKVGMLICWDLVFPEAWRLLCRRGARVVVVASFWTTPTDYLGYQRYNKDCDAVLIDSFVAARAVENNCVVVYCNAGGPPGEGSASLATAPAVDEEGKVEELVNEYTTEKYLGLSQVAVPFVGAVGKLAGGEEESLTVEVDMQILEDAEEDYRVREDMADPEWHYVLEEGKGEV